MKLSVPDWDTFRDPDAITYGTYVAGQDDQEAYIEGLLERFDQDTHDERLTEAALELLSTALAPSRYVAHGVQMLSAYLHQLAISSYVGNCAVFQTADQLRRVQLTAHRTKQLALTHPQRGFGTGERITWETAPNWQPIRRAIEFALVEFDWDRAFVVTNLVVKPVADLLLLDQLGRQAAAAGAQLDSLILESLWRDSRRSARWTSALVGFLQDADPNNLDVLQGHLTEFSALGMEMIDAGSRLVALPDGPSASDIAATVRADWSNFLTAMDLDVSGA